MRRSYLKVLWLVSLLLCTWLFFGCGRQGAAPTEKETGNTAAYIVTDARGQKVKMTKRPMRIVSLDVSTDEVLNSLVGPGRIAAFSKLADNRQICTVPPEALEQVKLRVDAQASESILAARPDLVLIADWRSAELADSLSGVGIPVFVYKTPSSIKEIEASIQEIGAITDDKERAALLVADMENKLGAVRKKLGNIPQEKRVKVVALSLMGAFGGQDTTFADICSYAQVRNMLAEKGFNKSQTVAKETLVEMDPDLLFMPTWNFGSQKSVEDFYQDTLNDPALQKMKAIQDKRLVQIPDIYVYSTSQDCVHAVELIAKAAYPQKFAQP